MVRVREPISCSYVHWLKQFTKKAGSSYLAFLPKQSIRLCVYNTSIQMTQDTQHNQFTRTDTTLHPTVFHLVLSQSDKLS